ncbi:hypothetical protein YASMINEVIRUS_288 [Yasminevirus sp. GU-2018]|uniref:Metallo-beta-lactamase domain-containing protein n=1 Tax=Yasminevirus sp. GU-2018 TaxID=2420051 RepID=A0A5K0U7R6_9VIRU|nr:hypothetical protein YASMINEVIRUS_288 [Yasminevirus sp. GU-2018]
MEDTPKKFTVKGHSLKSMSCESHDSHESRDSCTPHEKKSNARVGQNKAGKTASKERKAEYASGSKKFTHGASQKGSDLSSTAKIPTAYDIYCRNAVTVGPYTGIPSIAARHTAIEYGSILCDAGHVPREVGKKSRLVLITHFHADHGSDICNCVGYGERVTIFVPAYCAQDLFIKIRCDMSMQKGRPYTDDEIVKMVRIIGCKRNNEIDKERFGGQTTIMSTTIKDLVIAELVMVGDIVPVQLIGREQVAIEPFACYHTVDTCGYVIYELNKRLAPTITLKEGTYIDVNFTEDQPVRAKRSIKAKTDDAKSEKPGEGVTESTLTDADEKYDWRADPKFADVIAFSDRHSVPMQIEMVDEVKTAHFTLKVRRLHFPEGMNLVAKDGDDKCVLTGEDFVFLKKYRIDIHVDHLTPKTMFFGDTGAYVFNPDTVGYNRVMELLGMVETVIIESTFLESRQEMGEEKYKDRVEKRHMFLFDLYPIFKKFPKTKFLLIHFSACYDRGTITRYTKRANDECHNVSAFI